MTHLYFKALQHLIVITACFHYKSPNLRNVTFLYPLKTSENRQYRYVILGDNGLRKPMLVVFYVC